MRITFSLRMRIVGKSQRWPTPVCMVGRSTSTYGVHVKSLKLRPRAPDSPVLSTRPNALVAWSSTQDLRAGVGEKADLTRELTLP